YAPLAIIRWNWNDQQEIVGEVVHDCRKKFKPLTEQGCCCAYSVGDGKRSFGDFNSIQEAVDNLPGAGGKICVLPGEHWANVKINNRQNIQISGCGERSLILPHPDNSKASVFLIGSSIKIKIE